MNKQLSSKYILPSFLVAVSFFISTKANAELIGGIEFPDGAVSFADEVFSYSPGSDVQAPHNDPTNALGIPDAAASSLGEGGELVLKFTDNSLTTSGDATEDLWIFEGGDVEAFNVAISTNASSWIDLGDVMGQPTGIDIDSIPSITPGSTYSFVRLRDILPNQTGSPFGEADIDAVGAISSTSPPPSTTPEPSTILSLLMIGGVALGASKRKQS